MTSKSPVRFLMEHAAVGAAGGVVVAVGLVVADVAHLRSLVLASEVGWIAMVMMTFFFSLTFASVQMAISLYSWPDQRRGGGRRKTLPPPPALPSARLVPARVRRK